MGESTNLNWCRISSINPIYKPWMAIWKGSHNPRNRGLTITMVINHLLNGMILQVAVQRNWEEVQPWFTSGSCFTGWGWPKPWELSGKRIYSCFFWREPYWPSLSTVKLCLGPILHCFLLLPMKLTHKMGEQVWGPSHENCFLFTPIVTGDEYDILEGGTYPSSNHHVFMKWKMGPNNRNYLYPLKLTSWKWMIGRPVSFWDGLLQGVF